MFRRVRRIDLASTDVKKGVIVKSSLSSMSEMNHWFRVKDSWILYLASQFLLQYCRCICIYVTLQGRHKFDIFASECTRALPPILTLLQQASKLWRHFKSFKIASSLFIFSTKAKQGEGGRMGSTVLTLTNLWPRMPDLVNKLTSIFYASVLLLIMNFVITLSK